jgi:hypothetical protein
VKGRRSLRGDGRPFTAYGGRMNRRSFLAGLAVGPLTGRRPTVEGRWVSAQLVGGDGWRSQVVRFSVRPPAWLTARSAVPPLVFRWPVSALNWATVLAVELTDGRRVERRQLDRAHSVWAGELVTVSGLTW